MQFISLVGLSFIVAVAVLCRLTPIRLKPALLLGASYLFYCTWDPGMALALLIATVICYFAALRIEQLRSSKVGSALLTTIVSALVLYISFFKLRSVLGAGNSVAVPLGISYYTFRLISYVVDVYWGKIDAEHDSIRFAAFVAFFPHLVAGPIQRAEEFLPQVRPDRSPWESQWWRGVTRILLGCFKKLAVADPLSALVNYGVLRAGDVSSLPSAMAFYLFPLQLYMDFAALTDIAIGVGLLFGIESPENFDRPFAAPNISEFWRRWHMSLTGWLRDYVFMPVRMLLRGWGNAGLALSLTINMVLIAIWHGFRMNFLVFGLIHSGYLIVDAFSSSVRKRYYRKHPNAAKIARIAGPVFTYHLVAVADTFFRVPTFEAGTQVLAGLGGGIGNWAGAVVSATAPPNHHAWVALPFAAVAVCGDSLRRRWLSTGPELWPRWARWSAYAATATLSLFLVLVLLAHGQETNPFLYERF
jgi:alginate O-acetyltransferase complex protein AlgI